MVGASTLRIEGIPISSTFNGWTRKQEKSPPNNLSVVASVLVFHAEAAEGFAAFGDAVFGLGDDAGEGRASWAFGHTKHDVS
jgi:hypothetical protein